MIIATPGPLLSRREKEPILSPYKNDEDAQMLKRSCNLSSEETVLNPKNMRLEGA